MPEDFPKACPADTLECVNCRDHFSQLRPHIKEVAVTKHFLRDAPDFDVKQVVDCRHQYFTHLHKFEETVGGHHIFRAMQDGTHIVYAVDRGHRLIFLRAFRNFKQYEKFLEDKKKILHLIEG